jgi:glycosyltransferase involved in cell wall biosynthesis
MTDMQSALREISPPARDAVDTEGQSSPRFRIVHTVSSLQVGGMEQFVLRIAVSQRRQGQEVSILALRGGPLADQAREQGVPVHVPGGSHRAVRLFRALSTLARLQPDIVHAHNPTSLHYATLAKQVSRARVLMTDHGQGLGSVRSPGNGEWSRTDAVVAVSEAVAQRRDIEPIRGRTRVIPNGVEPAAALRSRAAVRAELGEPEDRIVAIIVARIDGRKGHETLLRALAHMQGTPVAARLTLWVAGDGAQRPAMEELAREMGLSPAPVRFLGFRSDVPDLLAAADLFILPSLAEGLPLSVLEAMAHRLPVIATPVGGVPEVVVLEETGLLVPTEEPEALAAAIERLGEDEKTRRRLGAAGYERVLREFSFDRMVERYNRLYQELRSPRKLTAR